MKKTVIYVLMVFCAAFLFVAFIPKAFCQTNIMTVKSYSSYISADTGDFIVVGEVQNNGTETITYGSLTGTVYSNDGQALAEAYYWYIYATQLLPGDTAPFYMGYSAQYSISENIDWTNQSIGRIDLQPFGISNTSAPLNLTLSITEETPHADPVNGNFNVSGLVVNDGNQEMANVQVVGAFYNSSGTVIAVGYTSYLSSPALPSGQAVQFSVSPHDSTPEIISEITSYRLHVISTGVPLAPTATPSSTPTTSAFPTPSESASPSATLTPSSSANTGTTPDGNLYLIIGAVGVVVIVVVVLAVLLKKRSKA
jgi:hypothetical protein